MCQYSAIEGSATDWHLMHLGQLSISGAALVFIEATAVEEKGRITPGCLGLYSDDNQIALEKVIKFVKRYGNTGKKRQVCAWGVEENGMRAHSALS